MEFYVIRDFSKTKIKSIYMTNKNKRINTCEVCAAITSEFDGSLEISYDGRGERGDYNRLPFWSVVSPEFISALEGYNITGVNYKDILLKDKKGQLVTTDLKEMEVCGRGGLLHDINGNEIQNCPVCNIVTPEILSEHDGLTVDNWDGSDIFYFDNWIGNPIVTERVKNSLENSNLKNIKLINVRSYIFNYTLKKWSEKKWEVN